jgi:hypothetical protein
VFGFSKMGDDGKVQKENNGRYVDEDFPLSELREKRQGKW